MTLNDKKRIAWITPDYFYDVDYPIVGELMAFYDIKWYVIWGKGSKRVIPHNGNIHKLFESPYRYRDPRVIKLYYELIKDIKANNNDIIYNGFSGIPYFYPLLFLLFDKKKIVHEGHEIDPYVSVNHDILSVWYTRYFLRRVGHTQVFSRHAEKQFHVLYPNRECTYVPMVTKDYGAPKHIIPSNKKVFLFFGGVRKTKRFDVLLDAFLSLDDIVSSQAELWVYGYCDGPERDYYLKSAEGRDNIIMKLDFVPDDLVADLFCSSTYLVQPYQQITQSGPMMIAYHYNLPIIATNIDGFRERILDGENGFLFEKNNVNDLKRVLSNCIKQSLEDYTRIKQNAQKFSDSEYGKGAVISKYRLMLDKIINN